MNQARFWCVAWLLAACGLAAPAHAETYVVDRVVAVVGTEPIWLSTLRQRARPFLLQATRSGVSDADQIIVRSRILRELLQQLVDERLVAGAAKKAQLEVQRAEVDRALDMVAKQNGMTGPELLSRVERDAGMTVAEYRRALERQLVEGKLLLKLFQSHFTTISEAELQKRYDQAKKKLPEGKAPPLEEMREQLMQQVHAEWLTEAKRKWLTALRSETHVEVRLKL